MMWRVYSLIIFSNIHANIIPQSLPESRFYPDRKELNILCTVLQSKARELLYFHNFDLVIRDSALTGNNILNNDCVILR